MRKIVIRKKGRVKYQDALDEFGVLRKDIAPLPKPSSGLMSDSQIRSTFKELPKNKKGRPITNRSTLTSMIDVSGGFSPSPFFDPLRYFLDTGKPQPGQMNRYYNYLSTLAEGAKDSQRDLREKQVRASTTAGANVLLALSDPKIDKETKELIYKKTGVRHYRVPDIDKLAKESKEGKRFASKALATVEHVSPATPFSRNYIYNTGAHTQQIIDANPEYKNVLNYYYELEKRYKSGEVGRRKNKMQSILSPLIILSNVMKAFYKRGLYEFPGIEEWITAPLKSPRATDRVEPDEYKKAVRLWNQYSNPITRKKMPKELVNKIRENLEKEHNEARHDLPMRDYINMYERYPSGKPPIGYNIGNIMTPQEKKAALRQTLAALPATLIGAGVTYLKDYHKSQLSDKDEKASARLAALVEAVEKGKLGVDDDVFYQQLKNAGVKEGTPLRVRSLVSEMVGDPTNYISFGTGKSAKTPVSRLVSMIDDNAPDVISQVGKAVYKIGLAKSGGNKRYASKLSRGIRSVLSTARGSEFPKVLDSVIDDMSRASRNLGLKDVDEALSSIKFISKDALKKRTVDDAINMLDKTIPGWNKEDFKLYLTYLHGIKYDDIKNMDIRDVLKQSNDFSKKFSRALMEAGKDYNRLALEVPFTPLRVQLPGGKILAMLAGDISDKLNVAGTARKLFSPKFWNVRGSSSFLQSALNETAFKRPLSRYAAATRMAMEEAKRYTRDIERDIEFPLGSSKMSKALDVLGLSGVSDALSRMTGGRLGNKRDLLQHLVLSKLFDELGNPEHYYRKSVKGADYIKESDIPSTVESIIESAQDKAGMKSALSASRSLRSSIKEREKLDDIMSAVKATQVDDIEEASSKALADVVDDDSDEVVNNVELVSESKPKKKRSSRRNVVKLDEDSLSRAVIESPAIRDIAERYGPAAIGHVRDYVRRFLRAYRRELDDILENEAVSGIGSYTPINFYQPSMFPFNMRRSQWTLDVIDREHLDSLIQQREALAEMVERKQRLFDKMMQNKDSLDDRGVMMFRMLRDSLYDDMDRLKRVENTIGVIEGRRQYHKYGSELAPKGMLSRIADAIRGNKGFLEGATEAEALRGETALFPPDSGRRSPEGFFEFKKMFKNPRERRIYGYAVETDPRIALEQRRISSDVVAARDNLVRTYGALYGERVHPVRDKSGKIVSYMYENGHKVKGNIIKTSDENLAWKIPDDAIGNIIMRDIKDFGYGMEKSALMRAVRNFQSFFIPFMTTFNPSFMLVNTFGNIELAFREGHTTPRFAADAIGIVSKVAANGGDTSVLKGTKYVINGKQHDLKDIVDRFMESGVITPVEFTPAISFDVRHGQAFDHVPLIGAYSRLMRRLNGISENSFRLAVAFDAMKRGLTDPDGIKQYVDDVLFNYDMNALSKTEQELRALFPFLIFKKRNIERTLKYFMEHPGRIKNPFIISTGLSDRNEDGSRKTFAQLKEEVPKWMTRRFTIGMSEPGFNFSVPPVLVKDDEPSLFAVRSPGGEEIVDLAASAQDILRGASLASRGDYMRAAKSAASAFIEPAKELAGPVIDMLSSNELRDFTFPMLSQILRASKERDVRNRRAAEFGEEEMAAMGYGSEDPLTRYLKNRLRAVGVYEYNPGIQARKSLARSTAGFNDEMERIREMARTEWPSGSPFRDAYRELVKQEKREYESEKARKEEMVEDLVSVLRVKRAIEIYDAWKRGKVLPGYKSKYITPPRLTERELRILRNMGRHDVAEYNIKRYGKYKDTGAVRVGDNVILVPKRK